MNLKAYAKTDTCFTYYEKCTGFITKEIEKAEKTLYVQAYSFTSEEIVTSILRAKAKGVKVKILLDKSNKTSRGSLLSFVKNNKIDVKIDYVPGIAHNKVIIIDDKKVITGSFNFSKSADYKNLENVIIIDEKDIVKKYTDNFNKRYKEASKTKVK